MPGSLEEALTGAADVRSGTGFPFHEAKCARRSVTEA
jgi:hypothetical protein